MNQPSESIFIIKASYIAGKKHLLNFSNSKSKVEDFGPLFIKYVKGDFSFFASPGNFKKFKITEGNLFCGDNEDLIFSAQTQYNLRYSKLVDEEILYVF